MPSDIYKQIIINRINAFLEESESIGSLTHAGMRGNIRESGFGKLITDLLPIDWGLGNGKIIDSKNNQSSETDLIIYYKRVLSPILFSEKSGLFPLDSCGFAFEVKTISTANEIRTTISKFEKLRDMETLTRYSEQPWEFDLKPIRVYFALSTDLKSEDEFERYKRLDKEYLENPTIQVICVVGKGVWFYHKGEEFEPFWEFYTSDGNHKELIMLLGTIVRQLVSIVTDGGIDMREYWIDGLDILKRELKW